jgi:ribonuclease-3
MRASSSRGITLLERAIGYSFRKKALIQEAITHKSFTHENPEKSPLFNERLEFLGDAVLSLVISEYLFKKHPSYTESQLSRLRAYTVRESTLVEAAMDLNLGRYLRLGKGEELSGGREKPSILANAFEALIGAIYLDGGIRKARDFILNALKSTIEEIEGKDLVFDYKSRLQEVSQARFGVLPRYVIHKEEGPEHNKTFEVKVYIKDSLYGTGRGKNKKSAQQLAAEAGLRKLKELKGDG